jgi:hypothetical protein
LEDAAIGKVVMILLIVVSLPPYIYAPPSSSGLPPAFSCCGHPTHSVHHCAKPIIVVFAIAIAIFVQPVPHSV